jgi:hypothetical protein
MSKPKPEWIGTKEQWYRAGQVDGERKMARKIRRWILKLEHSTPKESRIAFFDWLTMVCGFAPIAKGR